MIQLHHALIQIKRNPTCCKNGTRPNQIIYFSSCKKRVAHSGFDPTLVNNLFFKVVNHWKKDNIAKKADKIHRMDPRKSF